MLAKILSAHNYRVQLQVATQLDALYKYGSVVVIQPGVLFPSHLLEWVAGTGGCQPTITEGSLVGGALGQATVKKMLTKFHTSML